MGQCQGRKISINICLLTSNSAQYIVSFNFSSAVLKFSILGFDTRDIFSHHGIGKWLK
jgi:hypothetical protein